MVPKLSAQTLAALRPKVTIGSSMAKVSMKLLWCALVCAAAEHHAGPRPALLQRSESNLLAAKEEVVERTYTGRASVFDVFRAMEDEGAKRMGERPLKLLAKSVAAGVSGPDTASSLTEP